MSFWPEALLLTVIQVYILERESGVYLMKQDTHNGGSGGTGREDTVKSMRGKGSSIWMYNQGAPDRIGVKEENRMSNIKHQRPGRIQSGVVPRNGSSMDSSSSEGEGGGSGGNNSESGNSSDSEEEDTSSNFSCFGGGGGSGDGENGEEASQCDVQ